LKRKKIEELIKEKTLVLDGAMATMIQTHALEEKDYRKGWFENHNKVLIDNFDLLSLTRPDIIKEIHNKYFEAGADICKTNTFSATTIVQSEYGLEGFVNDMNYSSAKIAREIADAFTKLNPKKPRYVAGTIGPSIRVTSHDVDENILMLKKVEFEDLTKSYINQVKVLIAGGVDLLLVETVFDVMNAKAAVYAINRVQKKMKTALPVMISGTISNTSKGNEDKKEIENFLTSLSNLSVFSIGINCSFGAKNLKPYLKFINKGPKYVSVHPNAGLPNSNGEYEETPATMAQHIEGFLEEGLVNIVGGCCGTTPEHISAIADIVKKYNLRKVKD